MNIFSHMFEKRIVPITAVSFLTILTLGTSVLGVSKVVGSFSPTNSTNDKSIESEKSDNDISENEISEVNDDSNVTGTVKGTSTSNTASNSKPSTNSPVAKTGKNLVQGTTGTAPSTASPTAPATDPNACIITIFGKQYNVASLRNSHPGGDVFVCGADQSASYQGAHGTSVSRLAPYLVTSGSQGGTTTTGGGTTSSGTTSSGTTTGNSGSQPSGSVIGSSSSRHQEDDDDDDENESEDENEHEGREDD